MNPERDPNGGFPCRRKVASCTPGVIKHMVYYQCDRNEITGHLEACLPIISTMTTAKHWVSPAPPVPTPTHKGHVTQK